MHIKLVKETESEQESEDGVETVVTEMEFEDAPVAAEQQLRKQNKLLKLVLLIAVLFGTASFAASLYSYASTQAELQAFRSDASGQITQIAKNMRLAGGGNAPEPPLLPVDITLPDTVPFLGSADAKVVVVEYADFQCPFCGRFHEDAYKSIKAEYVDSGKVKFVYQDFAFLGKESVRSAEAAKCAGEQGQYWQYHDWLFTHQNGENEGAFADANLKKFARDLKLNTKEFNTCFDSGKFAVNVEQETADGRNFGVSGTPTTFVNGKPFVGAQPYANFKQAIEEALAQ